MNKQLSLFLSKELSKGSISVFVSRIIGVLFYFLFSIYISNNYGPAIFGEFIIFILLLNVLSMLGLLGLDQYTLQHLPSCFSNKDSNGITSLVGKSERILFWSIICLLSLSLLVLRFFPSLFSNNNTNLLLGLSLVPFVIFKFRLEGIRSAKKMWQYGCIAYVSTPLIALIAILSINTHFGTNSPFIAYAIAIFFSAIVAQFAWRIELKKQFASKLNSLANNAQNILSKSIPLMAVASLMFFNDWLDKLMLRFIADSYDLGLYGSAFRVVQFFSLPLISINAIAAPIFADRFKSDIDLLKPTVQQAVLLILLSSIPLAFIIFMFPEFLLGLFGSEFKAAKTALYILLIGQLVNVVAGPVGILLKMTQHQNTLLKFVFISILINFVLNLIWIPQYGINGAAAATAIAVILLNLLSIIFIKKELGFYSFIPGWK